MSAKNIQLFKGCEEGGSWIIYTRVKENGKFSSKGYFDFSNPEYYEKNRRRMRQQQNNYYQEHKEERVEYYKENAEHFKKYRKDHAKEATERTYIWNREHPIEYKVIRKRSRDRRKRNLGFEPLNTCFEGSEAHHMTKDVVIFIPKELHRSVRHNLETGEGMDEINGKALVWAGRQTNE